MRKVIALCAMLGTASLAACANNATTAASQTILAIEGSYTALATLATNYAAGKLTPTVDKTIVAQMAQADTKAYSYISALRTSAQSGGTVSDDVIAAAEQAILDYQSLMQKNGIMATTAAVSKTSVTQ